MEYPNVKVYGRSYATIHKDGSGAVLALTIANDNPRDPKVSAYRCSACGEFSLLPLRIQPLVPSGGPRHVKSIPSLPLWSILPVAVLPPEHLRWSVEVPPYGVQLWVGSYCDGRFVRIDPVDN